VPQQAASADEISLSKGEASGGSRELAGAVNNEPLDGDSRMVLLCMKKRQIAPPSPS